MAQSRHPESLWALGGKGGDRIKMINGALHSLGAQEWARGETGFLLAPLDGASAPAAREGGAPETRTVRRLLQRTSLSFRFCLCFTVDRGTLFRFVFAYFLGGGRQRERERGKNKQTIHCKLWLPYCNRSRPTFYPPRPSPTTLHQPIDRFNPASVVAGSK